MTISPHSVHRIALALAGALALTAAPAIAAPQTSAPSQPPVISPAPATPPAAGDAVATPTGPSDLSSTLQLDQIKAALGRPPLVNLDERQLRFYVEVVAKQPRFADYIKGYDFINGPTKGGNPMSHQEFLAMVTPKDLYSSAGITATELLQGALTNWIGQKPIARALEAIKNARSDKEVQEIRDRIDRELAALNASASR